MVSFIHKKFFSLLRVIVAFFYFTSICIFPHFSEIAQASTIVLPPPGVSVSLSSPINYPYLLGINTHQQNPFQIDFIVSAGDQEEISETDIAPLIRYFLAALTVPEGELWVNLSPHEQDRVIPDALGKTDLGKDLLEQDYLLKQLTASLMNPDLDIGSEFWKSVYQKAFERYGTTEIPVETFHKVWIVPENATVIEHQGMAWIQEQKLSVLLDDDYLAIQHRLSHVTEDNTEVEEFRDVSKKISREKIIPELEQEVNHGENFAPIRQIFSSVILAAWYKKRLKDSLINQVYSDQNKIAGINIDDNDIAEKIYQQYLQAFQKGVVNLIREDYDPASQTFVPRKYFSGGVRLGFRQVGQWLNIKLSESKKKIAPLLRRTVAPVFLASIMLVSNAAEAAGPETSQTSGPGTENVLVVDDAGVSPNSFWNFQAGRWKFQPSFDWHQDFRFPEEGAHETEAGEETEETEEGEESAGSVEIEGHFSAGITARPEGKWSNLSLYAGFEIDYEPGHDDHHSDEEADEGEHTQEDDPHSEGLGLEGDPVIRAKLDFNRFGLSYMDLGIKGGDVWLGGESTPLQTNDGRFTMSLGGRIWGLNSDGEFSPLVELYLPTTFRPNNSLEVSVRPSWVSFEDDFSFGFEADVAVKKRHHIRFFVPPVLDNKPEELPHDLDPHDKRSAGYHYDFNLAPNTSASVGGSVFEDLEGNSGVRVGFTMRGGKASGSSHRGHFHPTNSPPIQRQIGAVNPGAEIPSREQGSAEIMRGLFERDFVKESFLRFISTSSAIPHEAFQGLNSYDLFSNDQFGTPEQIFVIWVKALMAKDGMGLGTNQNNPIMDQDFRREFPEWQRQLEKDPERLRNLLQNPWPDGEPVLQTPHLGHDYWHFYFWNDLVALLGTEGIMQNPQDGPDQIDTRLSKSPQSLVSDERPELSDQYPNEPKIQRSLGHEELEVSFDGLDQTGNRSIQSPPILDSEPPESFGEYPEGSGIQPPPDDEELEDSFNDNSDIVTAEVTVRQDDWASWGVADRALEQFRAQGVTAFDSGLDVFKDLYSQSGHVTLQRVNAQSAQRLSANEWRNLNLIYEGDTIAFYYPLDTSEHPAASRPSDIVPEALPASGGKKGLNESAPPVVESFKKGDIIPAEHLNIADLIGLGSQEEPFELQWPHPGHPYFHFYLPGQREEALGNSELAARLGQTAQRQEGDLWPNDPLSERDKRLFQQMEAIYPDPDFQSGLRGFVALLGYDFRTGEAYVLNEWPQNPTNYTETMQLAILYIKARMAATGGAGGAPPPDDFNNVIINDFFREYFWSFIYSFNSNNKDQVSIGDIQGSPPVAQVSPPLEENPPPQEFLPDNTSGNPPVNQFSSPLEESHALEESPAGDISRNALKAEFGDEEGVRRGDPPSLQPLTIPHEESVTSLEATSPSITRPIEKLDINRFLKVNDAWPGGEPAMRLPHPPENPYFHFYTPKQLMERQRASLLNRGQPREEPQSPERKAGELWPGDAIAQDDPLWWQLRNLYEHELSQEPLKNFVQSAGSGMGHSFELPPWRDDGEHGMPQQIAVLWAKALLSEKHSQRLETNANNPVVDDVFRETFQELANQLKVNETSEGDPIFRRRISYLVLGLAVLGVALIGYKGFQSRRRAQPERKEDKIDSGSAVDEALLGESSRDLGGIDLNLDDRFLEIISDNSQDHFDPLAPPSLPIPMNDFEGFNFHFIYFEQIMSPVLFLGKLNAKKESALDE